MQIPETKKHPAKTGKGYFTRTTFLTEFEKLQQKIKEELIHPRLYELTGEITHEDLECIEHFETLKQIAWAIVNDKFADGLLARDLMKRIERTLLKDFPEYKALKPLLLEALTYDTWPFMFAGFGRKLHAK